MHKLIRVIDLPPVWLAAFAALAWAQTRVWPVSVFGDPADGVGWVLVALGVALGVAAVVQFGLQRTTLIPRRSPSDLVTGGVFRLSRNPIYLGDALVLTGLCLIWNAIGGVVLVPLFIAMIQKRFIFGEEAQIAELYGDLYEEYRTRVRRWL